VNYQAYSAAPPAHEVYSGVFRYGIDTFLDFNTFSFHFDHGILGFKRRDDFYLYLFSLKTTASRRGSNFSNSAA